MLRGIGTDSRRNPQPYIGRSSWIIVEPVVLF